MPCQAWGRCWDSMSSLKTESPMCLGQWLSNPHAVNTLQTEVEALPSMGQMLGQHVKLDD